MYNPANPQFSIDFILSKARGSLLASGLNNHAFNTAMTGMVLNFHHIIDRVLTLPLCGLMSVSWIKKCLKMKIVNRIKAQLSLAAAAQRQINQRNAAMISQKANLLRNFQIESNKAQSKFLHYVTFKLILPGEKFLIFCLVGIWTFWAWTVFLVLYLFICREIFVRIFWKVNPETHFNSLA